MEGQLLARQLPGDALNAPGQRLASLFDMHHDRLYRLARRMTSDTDDALDLVQETFLRAARFPGQVPIASAREEEAWLVRVLINIQRDQWRKKAIRKRHGSQEFEGRTRKSQSPEDTLIFRTIVWQALDRLPPRRRAILVMVELEGIQLPAVAGLLGINVITVRWHLSAARRELARTLKPHFGEFHENR